MIDRKIAEALRGEMAEFIIAVTLPGTPERFTRTFSRTAVVGRGDDTDLQLSHPLVSRRHAEISLSDDGRFEAVDLFWVHHLRGGAVTDKEIAGLTSTLNELLVGSRSPLPARETSFEPGFVSETTVRFIEGDDGALNVLEVETDDRSGLLLALSRALSGATRE